MRTFFGGVSLGTFEVREREEGRDVFEPKKKDEDDNAAEGGR